MPKTFKEFIASLTPEQRAEFMAELPAVVAGMTPEERKALDIREPEPTPPAPPKKSFLEALDEFFGSVAS